MLNIVYNSANLISFTGKETATSNLTYYILELENYTTKEKYFIIFDINNDVSLNKDRINIFHFNCHSYYEIGQYNYKVYEGTGTVPSDSDSGYGFGGSDSGEGIGFTQLNVTGLDILEYGIANITSSDIITSIDNTITVIKTVYEGQGT